MRSTLSNSAGVFSALMLSECVTDLLVFVVVMAPRVYDRASKGDLTLSATSGQIAALLVDARQEYSRRARPFSVSSGRACRRPDEWTSRAELSEMPQGRRSIYYNRSQSEAAGIGEVQDGGPVTTRS